MGWLGRTLAGVLAMGTVCAWGQGAPVPAGEAKTTVTMPPTPLLPQALGGWNADVISRADSEVMPAMLQNYEAFDAKTCLPALPGGVAVAPHPMSTDAKPCVDVLKEDGVQRLAVGSYRHQNAGPKVEIAVLEFVDATGAYSAYTFYRSRVQGSRISGGEARLAKLANETSADGEGTLLWAGTVVVRIKGRLDDADGKTLMTGLPKVGGRKALPPLLPSLFPAEVGGVKMDAASLRYSLGPVQYQAMGGVLPPEILGWDKAAEVGTATYAGHGNKGTLTLLIYPTNMIAGDRGRAIEKAINDAGAAKFGTVRVRRVGPLVGVTTGGLTAVEADKLVAELHLNEVATFDAKMPLDFHVEVRKTVSLLEGILIFTGVMALAAVVIAIFLGGMRAGIRVMLGKSAASDPEFLTIDLRDRPKALFVPKDGAPGDGAG